MTSPTNGDDGRERVSFTIRRTHLYALGGLAVGLALGVAVGGRGGGTEPSPLLAAQPPVTAPAPPPAGPDSATLVRALDVSGRPAHGPATALVTIVEFTDYQCVFCHQHFDSTLAPLLAQFEGRIRYVVKNYPIGQLHPLAFRAAEAAECAADQGQFWPYHDRLFRSSGVERTDLDRIAREVRLDQKRFSTCLDGRGTSLRVQRDIADGNALSLTGTPSFFINGDRIEGAAPLAAFAQRIEAALAASQRNGTSQ
jgi:protein-disulfide isomerase